MVFSAQLGLLYVYYIEGLLAALLYVENVEHLFFQNCAFTDDESVRHRTCRSWSVLMLL